MLASRLLSCVGGEETLYSDDVFQSFTRTGTGVDSVVTTGINMTKGYMLWSKGRSAATDHAIYDSARGVTFDLVSNSTASQTTQATGLKAVSSTGHTVGSLAKMNTSSATYVDWVFRKSPKFFDVVTYTGTGSTNNVAHSLGILPGMVVCKATSTTSNWGCVHGSIDTYGISLNSTAAANNKFSASGNTSTTFNPNEISDHAGSSMNVNGVTYVAYLFAHDPSADGIVQCGSFTTDGSGNATVNLGWEPQYLMTKITSTADNWNIQDSMRGLPVSGNTALLQANTSSAEGSGNGVRPSATGFYISGGPANFPYIYLAIRRSNKPPTVGTQVYNAIARTGTGAAATVTGVGFAPDLALISGRSLATDHSWYDRLRGGTRFLASNTANQDVATTSDVLSSFDMNGVTLGTNATVNGAGASFINHFFKRAPGMFSILCDTGTGVNKLENHNLGSTPELMIRKSRSAATQWEVYFASLGNTKKLVLNSTAAEATDATAWNSTSPSATQISVGTGSNVNTNAATYVTYLFSTLAGISKVFSYTGNGTSQTIDCGFTTGARYVLVKSTSATGNWNVGDSTRGLTSGTDPLLYLNSTAAEITTDDWLDPANVGFIVNETTNAHANVNGVTYIGLAFA